MTAAVTIPQNHNELHYIATFLQFRDCQFGCKGWTLKHYLIMEVLLLLFALESASTANTSIYLAMLLPLNRSKNFK